MLKKAIYILILAGAISLAGCVQQLEDEGTQQVTAAPGATAPATEATTTPQNENGEDNMNQTGIPPMPVDTAQDWRAPADLQNPNDLPVFEGPLAYRLQQPTRMLQLEPLAIGEELAILHTNKGDITMRFFPEEAPIAVTNFKALARQGYYDGVLFHRVIPGFMIQGGCPLGTGTGGNSVWGGNFGTERSFNLRHFYGAVAMAHAGPGTIGSQFYIVHNSQLDGGSRAMFEDMKNSLDDVIGILPDGREITLGDWHPAEGLEHFINHGGTPHLDWFWNQQGPHPVFAHVVAGMDVVDAIANTPQAGSNRPVNDMIIERISFKTYEG